MSKPVVCRGKTKKQCKRAPKSCKRAKGTKRSFCRTRKNKTRSAK